MIGLITTILKIFLIFLTKWFAWKAEERARFEERMKNMATLLQEAVEDKSEAINEADYLSNMKWEVKKRYESYKMDIAAVLAKGGGMAELKLIKTLGLNTRLEDKNDEAVEIIVKDLKIVDKAILLAKLLAV